MKSKAKACSCHGLSVSKTCPECGGTLTLMHIPGYEKVMGHGSLPAYHHVVISATMDLSTMQIHNWDRAVEQMKNQCQYKEYPKGQPPKVLSCEQCYVRKKDTETVAIFKQRHKGHKLRRFWKRE